ncbi:hypothetical protein [Sporanaerobium hydrogeniformans]|uniref:hypothetical protein n=1 Tax=Sporanaerobium hydrogeniformans TaxID=3072179 RepID=UPI00117A1145|nr:hypothetical protein [Sporanaerobium hydrogeniformans]
MKITDKVRWGICIVAASILIVVPVVMHIMDIPYHPQFMKGLEMAVLIIVLYFLVIYPRMKAAASQEEYVEEIEGEESQSIEENND